MLRKSIHILKGIKSLCRPVSIILAICILMVSAPINLTEVSATPEEESEESLYFTAKTNIAIDEVFGETVCAVDENIYVSLSAIDGQTLKDAYGSQNSKMFNTMATVINPCFALATAWGEGGESSAGTSLTTVMDFNADTYVDTIDWIELTSNLEQVDSAWYVTHTKDGYNTNEDGKAYHMPTALLQTPRSGSVITGAMEKLGIGPYQVTTSDWDDVDLDKRVNPIWSWKTVVSRWGTGWINCGITPISDLTCYAVSSLNHQGGALIGMDFGLDLIKTINKQKVQNAFNYVGKQMYLELKEKAGVKSVSLSDVNVKKYLPIVEGMCDVDFSDYTGGSGSTNKGEYVALHCLRYVFYKNYFSGGLDEYDFAKLTVMPSYAVAATTPASTVASSNTSPGSPTDYNGDDDYYEVPEIEIDGLNWVELSKAVADTFRDEYGNFDYSQRYGNQPAVINGLYIKTPFRDCSSYASAMMRFLYSDSTWHNSYRLHDNLMDWNEVNAVTFDDLQPGDVIAKYGHAAFVVAKDDKRVYMGDCGSTSRIQLTAEYGWAQSFSLDASISTWRSGDIEVYRYK